MFLTQLYELPKSHRQYRGRVRPSFSSYEPQTHALSHVHYTSKSGNSGSHLCVEVQGEVAMKLASLIDPLGSGSSVLRKL